MAEIYSDLPFPALNLSPHPSESLDSHDMSHIIHKIILGHQLTGLRSCLYPYQRESVSAMLLREMSEFDIPDPLYIPVTGMNKSVYYLQPATMEILQECPMVTAHHGGVLCEELDRKSVV